MFRGDETRSYEAYGVQKALAAILGCSCRLITFGDDGVAAQKGMVLSDTRATPGSSPPVNIQAPRASRQLGRAETQRQKIWQA